MGDTEYFTWSGILMGILGVLAVILIIFIFFGTIRILIELFQKNRRMLYFIIANFVIKALLVATIWLAITLL
jgi:hypothetical protein